MSLVAAFAARDAPRAAESLVQLAPPIGSLDRRALLRSVERLIHLYAERPLAEVPVVTVVNELLEVLRTQRLQPPPALSMVAKMLTMVDGVGRVLDPAFDMMGLLQPYGTRLLRQRLEPDAVLAALLDAASDASALGVELPAQLRRLLRRYEMEGVHLALDQRALDPTLRRLDALGDRLVAGILLAALLNAVGSLGATDRHWLSRTRGPLLVAGSAAAVALTGFLADSLRRRA